jgi:hypothetical protein
MKRSAFRLLALLLVCSGIGFAQQPVNDAQVAGTPYLTGNGPTGAGSQRVTIASDNTAFSVNATLSAETTKVIGTVRNLGNAGGITDFAGQNAAQPASSWLIGAEFNTSPTTLTTGNASPLQLDSSGKLLVNCTGCSAGSTVGLVPQTSGGVTLSHVVAAASTNATSLKASAGQVYDACVNSNATYPVYFKLYNKASAPTVGTDVPVRIVQAQAGVPSCIKTEEGYAFSTGIAWSLSKGITDADATAVLISDATVEISFK